MLGTDHTIWVSTLAGARPVRIDIDTSDQHGPSWSPDGNWISYWRLWEGKWEIAKVPVGGGKPITLMKLAFGFETVWSPSGQWIGFNNEEGLQLISPDGKVRRLLSKSVSPSCCARFGFSRDGATVYVLRPGAKSWEVVAIDVRGAAEKRVSESGIPLTTAVQGFSLNPNGKSFATSVGTSKYDIWLLENFERPGRRWLFRTR